LSYKDILVFLDDSTSNTDRMNAAFHLAEKHTANLTGVSLASLKPRHAKINDEQAIERIAEKLALQLVEEFTQAADQVGLVVNTIIIYGNADTSAVKMAHYARNYDIVLLHQPDPSRDSYLRLQEFAQQVLLLSGRPVLFMPYIGANKIPFKNIMIAWDGTPAASRAVHDAIPVLANAKDVVILVVESKKQKQNKSEVLVMGLERHLSNHNVNARIKRIEPGINNVPTVILNQIADNDIDLLVMGGYGTPTIKQKIFGGVSRLLLSSMIVPVLMSH